MDAIHRLLGRAALCLALSLAPAMDPARAETDAPIAGEPLPLRFRIAGVHAFETYRQDIRAAWRGDCEALMAAVDPTRLPPETMDHPDEDGLRLTVAIEMYDRGLCVPFDPSRATALARWRIERFPDDSAAALEFAWRL